MGESCFGVLCIVIGRGEFGEDQLLKNIIRWNRVLRAVGVLVIGLGRGRGALTRADCKRVLLSSLLGCSVTRRGEALASSPLA